MISVCQVRVVKKAFVNLGIGVCCKARTVVLYERIPLRYSDLQSHIMLGYGTGMYSVVRIRACV